MQPLRDEIGATQPAAMLQEAPSPYPLPQGEAIPSPRVGEKVRMRGVHWNSTKTAPCEMRRGDESLPKPECRRDRRQVVRSNEQVFLIVDADCVMSFRRIRIVPSQVCSAAQ